MTTDLRQVIEQREIDLRIYEIHQCIYYFVRSDYTTDEFCFYYILSMQCYISITSHSVYFAFTGIIFFTLI